MAQCTTVLLADDPSENDAFGGHQPLATAISETISSEAGGKAVALIGTYGSGKSTVIKLLTSDLITTNQNAAVFLFDAWAHQGDPLRRSFLEELCAHLIRIEWLRPDASSATEVGSLSSRQDTSESRTTSVITPEGLAVVVSLPFAAAGAALTAHFPPAAFLVPLPAYVASLAWLRASRKGDPRANPALLSQLFLNKPVEITSTTVTHELDPTSVEFRSLFEALLTEAKTAEADRCLVIVLDNLDRLPPEEAMTLFATMRTFFDPNSPHTPKEQSLSTRLWLIVPFDTTWLKVLSKAHLAGSDDRGTQGAAGNAENALANAGTNFLEKSFQVQFVVAEPVVGKWKEYFIGLLRTAFPMHGTSDLENVYFLYNQANAIMAPRTPRAMKQFINRLGALHRQWEDDVPFKVQAAYALYVRPDTNLRPALLANDPAQLFGDHSDTVLAIVASEQWRLEMAALYYGVPTALANHMLLSEPIAKALGTGDGASLQALLAIDGFDATCETVVGESVVIWRSKDFAAACSALQEIGHLHVHNIERQLRAAFSRLSEWSASGPTQDAIIDLFRGLNAAELRAPVTHLLQIASPPQQSKSETGGPSFQHKCDEWVKATSKLLLWSTDSVGIEDSAKALRVGPEPAQYYAIAKAVITSETAQPLIPVVAPATAEGRTGALAYIVDELRAGGDRSREALAILKRLLEFPQIWDGAVIVGQLCTDLAKDTDYDPVRTACTFNIFEYALYVCNVDKSSPSIARLFTSEMWLRHMATVVNDPSAFGTALFVFFMNDGKEQLVSNGSVAWERIELLVSQPERGDTSGIADTLTGAAVESDRLLQLLSILFESNRSRLAASIAQRAWAKGMLAPAQASTLLLTRYSGLAAFLGAEVLEEWLLKGVEQGQLDAHLAEAAFSLDLLPLYIARLKSVDIAAAGVLTETLEAGISEQDKTVWDAALKSHHELTALVKALMARGSQPWLGKPLAEALDDLIFAMTKQGRTLSPELIEDAQTLALAVQSTSMELALKRLSQSLQTSWNAGVLNVFGEVLLSSDAILRDPENFAVNAIANILRSGDTASIEWVAKLVANEPFVAQISDEARMDLIGKASTRQKEANEEKLVELLAQIQQGLSTGIESNAPAE